MKEATVSEYHKSVNKVVDYINQHLTESIDLKTVAGVANVSEYHFHRIFKAFIGESLASYITRLRIEKAASLLQITKLKLEDIAERSGYQSQYALSKAFKKHFGISPSAFRNLQTYFSSHSSESINLNHRYPLPQIKEVEEKQLVYIRIIAKYGSSSEYETAWKKLWCFAKEKEILNGKNESIGLSFDDPDITHHDRCRFYACITTDKPIKPEGEFGVQKIEKGKYAIFTLKGDYSGLSNIYKFIYFEWLPNSNYKLRNNVSFEIYLNNPNKTALSELLTEIYLPIY
ncbi:AraC family transcriptional regulator [Bacteroidales bacterium OttesenSCG-928-C19]|nr:AraC family transcriptional regulator [Bacteroidales bacterium OttesenSCG-928-C19]